MGSVRCVHIPLIKASHVTKPNSNDWEEPLSHMAKGVSTQKGEQLEIIVCSAPTAIDYLVRLIYY